MTKLSGSLPKGEGNGLSAIARKLRDSPHPYCQVCGATIGHGHWAGCPEHGTPTDREMRIYALTDGWVS